MEASADVIDEVCAELLSIYYERNVKLNLKEITIMVKNY
jgi:hypothetical protein